MCNLNDAVCDYDEDADDSKAAYARRVAVHTAYGVGQTQGLDWTAPLYFLLGGPSAQTPEAHQLSALSAGAPQQ